MASRLDYLIEVLRLLNESYDHDFRNEVKREIAKELGLEQAPE